MKPKNKSITAVAIFIILVLISAALTRSVTSVYHAKPFWRKEKSIKAEKETSKPLLEELKAKLFEKISSRLY